MDQPATQNRVPTFVVVDEAHNLMPAITKGHASESLRDQFRTIAAEGRKFGVFLILCTQRPDKLDPLVISECENVALMRIGSKSVLNTSKDSLGLGHIPGRRLEQCLAFEKGRVMICGKWTNHVPEVLFTAMRRTVEGGADLDPKHWAC